MSTKTPGSRWLLSLFLLAGWALTGAASGQICAATGEVVLESQAQVNDFHAVYGPCDRLEQSLTISQGSGLEPIVQLTGLAGLSSLSGDLFIQANGSLSSLSGLAGLTAVEGDVFIEFVPKLANLTGLDALTSVDGSLTLANNALLAELSGLSALSWVGGDLLIVENPRLTQCGAVAGLLSGSVGGTADFADNGTGCNSESEILGGS